MLATLLQKNFRKTATLANLKEFIPAIHARDGEMGAFNGSPDPRMFRNEGPKFPELYPKTIYIVRDPRAVYVSYYHHCVHDTGNPAWPLEDFVDEMMTHGCIKQLEEYIVRWDRQVLLWLERSKKQPVKIVRYEDMIEDRRKVLQEVVEFVGIDCAEEDIHRAVEKGTFDSMRQEEVTHGAESFPGEKGSKGFFVRKGKIDGWKEEMSPEVAERIASEFSEAMKKVGYR
jgi:hypothetical protein